MKKFLKNIILNLILVLTLVISISSVKAIAKDDQINFNGSNYDYGVDSQSLYITAPSRSSRGSWFYMFHNYSGIFKTGSNAGQNVKLYCLDPQSNPNVSGEIVSVQSIENFDNVNSGNLVDKAKLYGLAMILQNGAHSVSDSNRNLLITDMAVRAYTYFILHDKADVYFQSGNDVKASSLMNLIKDVASESAYQSALKNELGVNYNVGGYVSDAKISNYKCKDCVEGTKTLIRTGLNAALEFKRNGGLNASVEVKVTPRQNNNLDEFKAEVEEKIYSFTIKQLSEGKNGYVKIGKNDIKCNNCEKYGIKITKAEYQDKNGKWQALPEEPIDLAAYVSKTGTALIKVTLNKQTTLEETCGASITLNYLVPSPINVQLFFVKRSTNSKQRYVGGLMTGSNTQTGSTTKQFTEQLSCLTVPCDTELETPACSPDSEGIATVKAPADVKRCIIGKTDDAGNTYQAIDGINNNYCATYCKEDYQKIELNRALNDLKCGSYFKLKAHIEGSQDCYRAGDSSNGAINHNQFILDITEAQMNLVEAYNNYAKAQAALVEFNKLKAQAGNDEKTYSVKGTYEGQAVDKIDTNSGTLTLKKQTYDYNYEGKSLEELEKLIQDDLDQANKDLDSKSVEGTYRDFENIISSYNACVTNLDKDFAFQQKVIWEYTEYTSDNYKSNDLKGNTTLNDLVSEENRTLAPVGEKVTTKEVMACTGEVTDQEYTQCSTGWVDPNETFSNYTYTICDKDGCRNSNEFKLSNAKYVKLHMTASLDYESKNSFNQVIGSGPLSGAITSNNSLNSSYAPGVQTKPLEGLPLSLDSAGGGIFKLKIQDLGEFYGTPGAYGRLIDYGNSADNIVANKKGVDEVWNGEYTCYYKNDCRIPECPDCDFECVTDDGGECKWRECPDCDFTCVNCIFNLGKLQLNNKTVSTNNFNSANREYGYNWNINTDLEELELIRDKADETIKEIEDANTTIYNNTGGKDSKLEFEITLTPDITNYIREYNDSVENAGGYGNDSLTCYNYQDEDNIVHQNMFCYSDFIDDLIEHSSNNIYVKDTRASVDKRATNGLLNNYDYWTPWTEKYDNPDVIGGPAWK